MAEAGNPIANAVTQGAVDKSRIRWAMVIGAGIVMAILTMSGAIPLQWEFEDSKSIPPAQTTHEHEITQPNPAFEQSLAALNEKVLRLAAENEQLSRTSDKLLERLAALEARPTLGTTQPKSRTSSESGGSLEARVLAVETGITREGQARLDSQELVLARVGRLEGRLTQEEATRLTGQMQALDRMKAIETRVATNEARN